MFLTPFKLRSTMKSHAALGHLKIFYHQATVNVATCATYTYCVALSANHRHIRNKEKLPSRMRHLYMLRSLSA